MLWCILESRTWLRFCLLLKTRNYAYCSANTSAIQHNWQTWEISLFYIYSMQKRASGRRNKPLWDDSRIHSHHCSLAPAGKTQPVNYFLTSTQLFYFIFILFPPVQHWLPYWPDSPIVLRDTKPLNADHHLPFHLYWPWCWCSHISSCPQSLLQPKPGRLRFFIPLGIKQLLDHLENLWVLFTA